MKNEIILVLFFLFGSYGNLFGQESPKTASVLLPELDTIYNFVERMPIFFGCDTVTGSDESVLFCSKIALYNYVRQKLRWETREGDLPYAKIFISFVIKHDGSVGDIKIAKSNLNASEYLHQQIVDIISNMPIWAPGYHNKKPVNVRMVIPIHIHFR